MQEPAGTSVPKHGTRSSYVKGCRCSLCRSANSEYYKTFRKNNADRKRSPARKGEELVDATRGREYLNQLSKYGIGRKTVHKACGVSKRLIWDISAGKASRIYRSTESRILAINPQDVLPRGAYVANNITLQQISELVKEGFTRGDIAERLHRFSDRLRVGEKGSLVRASTAMKVNKLYRLLMSSEDEQGEFSDAA